MGSNGPLFHQVRAENHEAPGPVAPYASPVDSQPSADDVQPLLRRAAAFADFEDDGRWAIIRELHRRPFLEEPLPARAGRSMNRARRSSTTPCVPAQPSSHGECRTLDLECPV
jgi:hypothetical protein